MSAVVNGLGYAWYTAMLADEGINTVKDLLVKVAFIHCMCHNHHHHACMPTQP